MEALRRDGRGWLQEDLRVWRKQRATPQAHPRQARRGGGFGSYETVRNFVRAARSGSLPGRREREAQGTWSSIGAPAVPGRLRPGGLPRPRDAPAGPLPGSPRFHHSTSGSPRCSGARRPRCVCHGLRAAFGIRRRRAAAGGVRPAQRHRGRQGRLQGRDVGALPGVRRPLQPRLRLHRPYSGSRKGGV